MSRASTYRHVAQVDHTPFDRVRDAGKLVDEQFGDHDQHDMDDPGACVSDARRTLHIHPLGVGVRCDVLIDELFGRLAHMLHHDEAAAPPAVVAALATLRGRLRRLAKLVARRRADVRVALLPSGRRFHNGRHVEHGVSRKISTRATWAAPAAADVRHVYRTA